MIERFSDGLKKSASRAGEFYQSPSERRPQLFIDFIEGIKVAAGSAHQLFHTQQNSNWLNIRDNLEKIIEVGRTFPPSNGNNTIWVKVKTLLEDLEKSGRKLALNTKAMSRTDLLVDMSVREQNARLDTEAVKPV